MSNLSCGTHVAEPSANKDCRKLLNQFCRFLPKLKLPISADAKLPLTVFHLLFTLFSTTSSLTLIDIHSSGERNVPCTLSTPERILIQIGKLKEMKVLSSLLTSDSRSRSMSPFPLSHSAPGVSNVTIEPRLSNMRNPILTGKFSFISLVITLLEMRFVKITI